MNIIKKLLYYMSLLTVSLIGFAIIFIITAILIQNFNKWKVNENLNKVVYGDNYIFYKLGLDASIDKRPINRVVPEHLEYKNRGDKCVRWKYNNENRTNTLYEVECGNWYER